MLELKDATLSVDGRLLMDRLSLMAHKGQMTCITGPKGCGKTLLLRVLMGVVPLDKGLVSVDGELISELSASAFRKLMAYVPQTEETVAQRGFIPDTNDMETAWSGEGLEPWEPKTIGLPVVTIQDKDIVLADDPPTVMLSQLRTLANEGRTVVVTSEREEFLNMSDKIIRLGKHEDNGS